jgi:hypothetical protein
MNVFAVAALAAALSLAVGAAEARQKTVEVVPQNKTCFDVDYVPALYSVNSRGKLARKAGVQTSYAIVEQVGGTATVTRQPAIYIETRKLVEPDHYTMRPVACK